MLSEELAYDEGRGISVQSVMFDTNDTIVALATPVGTSAIAVVRISGQQSHAIARIVFGKDLKARVAQYASYRNVHGEMFDDVVVVYFAGPKSYTGEDVVEISCHGNMLIVKRIVEDLIIRGCRQAGPGEFTRRAFLSGKMDLSQAEAVMDVINSDNERSLRAASLQLRGGLGLRLKEVKDRLLKALARVEAYIDFPDDDLPHEDKLYVESALMFCKAEICSLLNTASYGGLLRNGIKAVIVGEPNAGKSSLFNTLLGVDRALVGPEPGTTRDYIEEPVAIGLSRFQVIDTAGFNKSPGEIEERGISKTIDQLRVADVVIWVVDSSRPFEHLPGSVQSYIGVNRCIIVLSKVDIVCGVSIEIPSEFRDWVVVRVSALTGAGMAELRESVESFSVRLASGYGEESLAINVRHVNVLERAKSSIDGGLALLARNGSGELLSSEIRYVFTALGEVVGVLDMEQVLDEIFASFCIGK